MIPVIILFFITVFSMILQSIVALPLFVVSFIVLSLLVKDPFVFVVAFVLGFLFDSMSLQALGTSSLFLLGILLLIRLYERKFETRNIPFVLMISVIALSSYLVIFGSYFFVLQFVISLSLAFILFLIFNRFVPVTR